MLTNKDASKLKSHVKLLLNDSVTDIKGENGCCFVNNSWDIYLAQTPPRIFNLWMRLT